MRRYRALPAALALAGLALPSACTPLPDYVPPTVAPMPASAPVPDRIEAVAHGERVLLSVQRGRGAQVVKGRVLAADTAGVRLAAEAGDTLSIERARIMELWVSRGTRSRGSSAGRGFLFGTLAGGGLGYAVGEDCGGDSFVCFDRSDTALGGALAGGVVGTLLGAAFGGGEHWKRVPLPGRAALRFTPEPAPGSGVSLVRLEF